VRPSCETLWRKRRLPASSLVWSSIIRCGDFPSRQQV